MKSRKSLVGLFLVIIVACLCLNFLGITISSSVLSSRSWNGFNLLGPSSDSGNIFLTPREALFLLGTFSYLFVYPLGAFVFYKMSRRSPVSLKGLREILGYIFILLIFISTPLLWWIMRLLKQ